MCNMYLTERGLGVECWSRVWGEFWSIFLERWYSWNIAHCAVNNKRSLTPILWNVLLFNTSFNRYGRIQMNVFLLLLTLTWLVGHCSRLTCLSHLYTFLCNYMSKFKLGIHVFGQSPVTAISDSRPLHVRNPLLIIKKKLLTENMSAIMEWRRKYSYVTFISLKLRHKKRLRIPKG